MDTVKVAFRFVGNLIDLQHITNVIGLRPSTIRVKGDLASEHTERKHPTNYWGLESDAAPEEPLSMHLHRMMDMLEPHLEGIRQLRKESYEPIFFCGLFYTNVSGDIKLDAYTLSRLAEFGISLEINAYDRNE
jgi:hypothetical protein